MSGNLFIISAASGTGKTSLLQAVLARDPQAQVSISHTTRPQRPGEVDGENYHFVSTEEFQQLVESTGFLEHAEVFGNFYGTSQAWVAATLASGKDVILEIDWQGAAQIRKTSKVISIFILPPSLATLKERLQNRGQDEAKVIERRLNEAQSEIAHYAEYDYLVVNDDFDTAVAEISAILTAERCRNSVQSEVKRGLLQDLLK